MTGWRSRSPWPAETTTAGEVVRIGDTVRRPPRESTRAVRALLLHLERVGFDGAPRYLDTDQQGREVLTFVEGDVPLPPYPAWSMSDDALDSFGELRAPVP